MKKIGIICEYNPFHNGHLYHINKIKEMYPDSFITLVMSSSFTERGEVSFLTKWDKTRIALNNYIDLIIELPFIYATQSADTFAEYAVTILSSLDMDYLIFGSESNDIDKLKNMVSTMLYNIDYNNEVKTYLDLGYNYPTSMSKALYNITGIKIDSPNDLLGISYIKAIVKNDFNLEPITIKRTNDYLKEELTGPISSATSIRKAYLNNLDVKEYIPTDTLKYLNISKDYMDNYFYLLKYRLISEINELDKYLDVDEGIDKRIKKVVTNTQSYYELIDKIKTKRYTYNRLNRMFLHILTGLKKEDKVNYQELNYIRVLGFNTKGREYLKHIKKEISIPIITNYKDLDDFTLKFELKVTLLYLQIIKRDDLILEELKSIPIQKD